MNDPILIAQILILLIAISYFSVNHLLVSKHKNYVISHQSQVPSDFKDHISLKDHQKSARYVYATSTLEQYSLVFDIILFLLFTFGGGLNLLQTFTSELFQSQIYSDIASVLIFMTIISIVNIPFGVYKTFGIEQKFGFNKQSSKDFVVDLIKSFILSTVLISFLLFVIFYLIGNVQNWWFWAAIFVIAFNLLMSFVYPTLIAPIFNRFKPIEKGKFLDAINQLLDQCKFKNKGVFVMDGSRRSTHLNAYFTGFGSNKRIVLFDTLMEKLSVSELKSVLAHELGHYHHRHIQKRLMVLMFQVLIAFYVLYLIKDSTIFYSSFAVSEANNGSLIILLILFLPMLLFFLQPISSYLSRKHEFEADHFAAQTTDAKDLISALLKLYRLNSSTLTPHPLYSKYFHSHPPAKERIDHLKEMQSN